MSDLPSLEQRMDDVRAVMDAAASEQAALFGISEGGPMCTLFAASHPERTRALVLFGTAARVTIAPGYPIGIAPDDLERFIETIGGAWGTGVSAELFAPSLAHERPSGARGPASSGSPSARPASRR